MEIFSSFMKKEDAVGDRKLNEKTIVNMVEDDTVVIINRIYGVDVHTIMSYEP